MTGESDNLPSGGTDNTNPSDALDHPDNLDFWEPGDEPDTSQIEGGGTETDSETDEPEDGQEADDSETAGDDEADDEGEEGDDADQPEIKDDVTVTVNGEKLALSELKSGYMRRADHTRKTQELSNQRQALSDLSNRVTTSVNAIAELLTASVPPMPDQALALTDPQKHYRMKVLHDTAMAKVAEVIEKANEPKEAVNQLTQQQRAELIQSENAKLVEAFPQTATPEGRKKFFESAASVARELGYSDEEIGQATDHRMFALAHYARIGMQAEASKAKAKQKVANVPPVAPAKRQPSTNASKARRNQEAMKRLNNLGSIEAALAVDWE